MSPGIWLRKCDPSSTVKCRSSRFVCIRSSGMTELDLGGRVSRAWRFFLCHWPGVVWRVRQLGNRVSPVADDAERRAVVDAAGIHHTTAIAIHRGRRDLRLYRIDQSSAVVVESYRIGVGRGRSMTPRGQFAIQTMLEDPVWHVPNNTRRYGDLAGKSIPAGSLENRIAARWIGFHGPFGIHGLESGGFGLGSSDGCVVMSEVDVIDLFSRVKLKTPVIVI
jgi:lipoprotein-anchoring transpeptidase ErfK/SrfK